MRKVLSVLVLGLTLIGSCFAEQVAVNRAEVVDDTLTLEYLTYDEAYNWSGIKYTETCEQEDNDFFFEMMMDLDMFFDKGVTYRIGVYLYDDNGNLEEKHIIMVERLTDSFFESTWRYTQFFMTELD